MGGRCGRNATADHASSRSTMFADSYFHLNDTNNKRKIQYAPKFGNILYANIYHIGHNVTCPVDNGIIIYSHQEPSLSFEELLFSFKRL